MNKCERGRQVEQDELAHSVQGKVERIRRSSTFLLLSQIVWDI